MSLPQERSTAEHVFYTWVARSRSGSCGERSCGTCRSSQEGNLNLDLNLSQSEQDSDAWRPDQEEE